MNTQDLPAGVKFTYNGEGWREHIYMKMGDGGVLAIKQGERHPYLRLNSIPDREVNIIEWPEHCGPRPIREIDVPPGMKYRHGGFVYTAIRLGLPNTTRVSLARVDSHNFCDANRSRGRDYVTLVEFE